MHNAILFVLLIPLLTGIFSLFAWGHARIQKALFIAAMSALVLAAIYLLYAVNLNDFLVIQSASWQAPFGITLVADLFSAIMVMLTAIIAFMTSLYALSEIDEHRIKFGFYPLMNFLVFSVCGAFLTGDIFNLFVWFELMLISSFVLMALGNSKAQLEASIKYVTINMVASAFFLAGIGVIYGLTGTLNMADIALRLPAVNNPALLDLAAVFFFIAFGVKAAVFPLYNWLPASYHTPPISVSAFFAGMLTKVGVYAFIRFFTLIFNHESVFIENLLLFVAATTMFFGVLGAAAQMDFRKVLSFHIISQIGYMIMGLAIGTKMALAGSVFYIMHHIIVKSNLFLISGVVRRFQGSFHLKKIGGVYSAYPFLSILFVVSAFSLAGFPPLSGFWAKFVVIKGGIEAKQYFIVIVALVVGLLTLYSMTKIWNEAFWKPMPENDNSVQSIAAKKTRWFMMLPIVLLSTMTLCIGVFAEPVFVLAQKTATQLLNPTDYIRAVLGN
ncbi:Na+/H+ antiporter subunit D [Ostreibacterium oceani]|uniref:Na+/H+ antiporter subunit D n=1 Tax=Ostreibacterium oceani TaxID=2654998 RepID=A0A6N7EX45_9GAMM|nr:Na+/H+ antiporter subunit D [Ostreibacterium oceani]MPV86513.1 Na+/H+ antiporter subunit D [Ostreibacterium oceani]